VGAHSMRISTFVAFSVGSVNWYFMSRTSPSES
jgi:hypothetical protein